MPRDPTMQSMLKDEWYPLTASHGMDGTRGPLSRLNTSDASTHANVVATMMEVDFLLFPYFQIEPQLFFLDISKTEASALVVLVISRPHLLFGLEFPT